MICRTVLGIAAILFVFSQLFGCRKNDINESQSPGEKTFKSYCNSCHTLPKPADKTDNEWPAIVEKYGVRAKLSQEQINQIISYLTANN